MAEKKSLEYLNKLHSKIVRSPFAKNVTEQEMLALIEGKKTLEEVQQYRALGMTPEQVKEMQIEYCVKSTILEEYKALGTVEELRVAKGVYDKMYNTAKEMFKDDENRQREFREKLSKSFSRK